jgi:hypothetical protein
MRGPLVLLVSAMLVVAGCARSASPSSAGASVAAESPAGIGDAGGGSHGPAFVVQVSFTGETEIHGSFLDLYTGRAFGSCAAYATAPLWRSPGAVTGTERVDGLPVSFDFALPPGEFAGPGNYAPGVMGRLSIGTDSYVGTESWVTLNGDGSGRGWFSGFTLEGGAGAGKSESGTVAWTCSG